MQFKKAVKGRGKLRLALIGPSGSGKTYTALSIAQGLAVDQSKIAFIDTEHGSASKYADLFGFDVLELESFSPGDYVKAIAAAVKAGYEVVVIDSLSHAWVGKNGALEMVDKANARSKAGNSFAAWREVTPEHNSMVNAIVSSPIHIIATMRSKTEYVMEKDERTGKLSPRKIGLAPVQRDGLEYEFDIVADIDHDHKLIVSKSRMPLIADAVITKAGAPLGQLIKGWIDGVADAIIAPAAEYKPVEPLIADSSKPVREEQLAMLKQLGKLAKVGSDFWTAVKEEYDIVSSTELTQGQADKVISDLGDIIKNAESAGV